MEGARVWSKIKTKRSAHFLTSLTSFNPSSHYPTHFSKSASVNGRRLLAARRAISSLGTLGPDSRKNRSCLAEIEKKAAGKRCLLGRTELLCRGRPHHAGMACAALCTVIANAILSSHVDVTIHDH